MENQTKRLDTDTLRYLREMMAKQLGAIISTNLVTGEDRDVRKLLDVLMAIDEVLAARHAEATAAVEAWKAENAASEVKRRMDEAMSSNGTALYEAQHGKAITQYVTPPVTQELVERHMQIGALHWKEHASKCKVALDTPAKNTKYTDVKTHVTCTECKAEIRRGYYETQKAKMR